jgi:hypothetical protein
MGAVTLKLLEFFTASSRHFLINIDESKLQFIFGTLSPRIHEETYQRYEGNDLTSQVKVTDLNNDGGSRNSD